MEVSIQTYRMQIGCFANNQNYRTKKVNYQNFNHNNTKHNYSRTTKNQKTFNFTSMILKMILVFSLSCSITSHYSTKSNMDRKIVQSSSNIYQNSVEIENCNFSAHYKYGNRNKKNGIKIMHWNMGGGYLINKMNEIETVINAYRPHVFGISETCFKKGHNLSDIQVQDYAIYFSKTLENPSLNVSRVMVYVHKDIVKPKLRTDLMNDAFSSVWLEIGLKRQKRLLICNAYREWGYLGQEQPQVSKSVDAQLDRWLKFLEKWEAALRSNLECHVLMDANLNFLNWQKPNLPASSQSRKLRPLIQALFDRILPLGVVQCVGVATRFWNGAEPSGLDHYYTTHPNKLSEVQAHHHGSSDHKIITATRYSKSINRSQRIIKKRSYKNFDPSLFIAAVRKIPFLKIYQCENVKIASEMLTSELCKILDIMAPIKVFQVRSNYAPWLSNSTKALMKERDEAQKLASISKKPEDWRKYKSIRNSVNNRLKTEKKNWQTQKLSECCDDNSKTWKYVKSWLGWSTGGATHTAYGRWKIDNQTLGFIRVHEQILC